MRDGLENQQQQRICHDLERILPTLHGIVSMLPDVNLSDPSSELVQLLAELKIAVDSVYPYLPGKVNVVPTASISIPQSQHVIHNSGLVVQGYSAPEDTTLLPLSPERKQKRKKSYAVR